VRKKDIIFNFLLTRAVAYARELVVG